MVTIFHLAVCLQTAQLFIKLGFFSVLRDNVIPLSEPPSHLNTAQNPETFSNIQPLQFTPNKATLRAADVRHATSILRASLYSNRSRALCHV